MTPQVNRQTCRIAVNLESGREVPWTQGILDLPGFRVIERVLRITMDKGRRTKVEQIGRDKILVPCTPVPKAEQAAIFDAKPKAETKAAPEPEPEPEPEDEPEVAETDAEDEAVDVDKHRAEIEAIEDKDTLAAYAEAHLGIALDRRMSIERMREQCGIVMEDEG